MAIKLYFVLIVAYYRINSSLPVAATERFRIIQSCIVFAIRQEYIDVAVLCPCPCLGLPLLLLVCLTETLLDLPALVSVAMTTSMGVTDGSH